MKLELRKAAWGALDAAWFEGGDTLLFAEKSAKLATDMQLAVEAGELCFTKFPLNPPEGFLGFAAQLTVRPVVETPFMRMRVAEDGAAQHILHAMARMQRDEWAPLAEALLAQLLKAARVVRRGEGHRFDEILEYIHTHLADSLSVVRLASLANMERSHFSKTFKELVGVAPQEYVMTVRMEHAAAMLKGKKQAVRVAQAVGYQDEKTFSRAFKKTMGCAPSVYRRTK